jgi:hypothetical protein
MNRELHDSLFELYMQGGLELALQGAHGLKRELIIRLETSALTPEKGEIIHYYAVNRWDEYDEFDEWAKPLVALSLEAEAIIGVTNAQLECCRSADLVLEDFRAFVMSQV